MVLKAQCYKSAPGQTLQKGAAPKLTACLGQPPAQAEETLCQQAEEKTKSSVCDNSEML